jgi:hypothetical protein
VPRLLFDAAPGVEPPEEQQVTRTGFKNGKNADLGVDPQRRHKWPFSAARLNRLRKKSRIGVIFGPQDLKGVGLISWSLRNGHGG